MTISTASRDPDRVPSLLVANALGQSSLVVTGLSLTNANPMHVAVVDGSGNQITSFSGGGGSGNPNGQTTMANSAPVVIASDQSAIQTQITDGTNVGNVLKSDGTAAGQNAQLVAGTGYTTATLTLNSGSPNTIWFDMLNFAWVSVEVLTNTTPATLTWQTSGDASQTNVSGMPLLQANSTTGVLSATTTSATGTFHGPRTGRYFRVSSNNGAGTTTLVLTFHTVPSAQQAIAITGSVASSNATGSAVPANAFYIAGKNSTGLLTGLPTVGAANAAFSDPLGVTIMTVNNGDFKQYQLVNTTTNADALASDKSLFTWSQNGVWNGATWDRARTPNTFKTVTATASGNTALWTPTTGKKFRLMRYMIEITNDASLSVAGALDIILQDSTSNTAAAFSLYVPSTGGTTAGAMGVGWVDLGNGILSAAANNVLNINLSSALATGKVRVVAIGTEE